MLGDSVPIHQHYYRVSANKKKMLLTEVPVLAAPRFDQSFQLQVDASNVGAGAVLLQRSEDGIDHPMGFFSRKFNLY